MFCEAVERALAVALDAHTGQVRRGSSIPYVVHPIQVALFLARQGHSSVILQAGLLHDVVEDCEDWTHERIQAEFGGEVASIVDEVTEDKSLTWAERKQWMVDSVPRLSPEALAVKACDKLHNLESLALALEEAEDAADVWGRFRGGRERTLKTSHKLVEALAARLEGPVVDSLRSALHRIREA